MTQMASEPDASHAPQKPVNNEPIDRTQTTDARTHGSISHVPMSGTNDYVDMAFSTERRTKASAQSNTHSGDYAKAGRQNPRLPPTPVDLADKVKGMYRLLDLIGESGSNGYVDKIVIAQDSLQRFINAVSPGTYASITKVNFKALDQFMIKPLGVYGSKSEIVRLLQSMGAVDENVASLLLVPSDVGDSRSTLSSGLYIVRANTTILADERHYVIYWPEDTTWNDSSPSSVLHTRAAFMRYLTKLCDQVAALLSHEHSASIVWDNQRSDNSPSSTSLGNSMRNRVYRVLQTSEHKESVVTQLGFQMTSHHISLYETPPDFPVDPTVFTPQLLPGETTQGFMTVSYNPRPESIATDRRELLAPELEFQVHVLDITSTDKQDLQLDPKYIPKPLVNDRLSSTFRIPINMDLAFFQILENEMFLLVLLDEDSVSIYLERLSAVDIAIERNRPIKRLNRHKLGERVLFAFDEAKRALVVCASTKLHLYMFVFDEIFRMLHLQGGSISLESWYHQEGISIVHISFVCGNEEVVLVDSSARARIFSFVTQQFRPGSIQFVSLPSAIFSSPDGSCLLVLTTAGPEQSLTAYHWETFGSNPGIPLDLPKFPLRGAVLTSMVRGGRVFLVGLDIQTRSIQSIAIDITTKRKEYTIERDDNSYISNNRKRRTEHNILLDCHAQVWSRFPVIPAVGRRTVTSSSLRQQKSITFIAENYSQRFDSYFSDLIQTFERTTRKPTGDELHSIKVSATHFEAFQENVVQVSIWGVSRYRLGEWLVDLLCLIPIHIAISRENTFIPLADGVLSTDFERSLRGAEVHQIVDKLSFGWYESIFRSYLATKPVKVVSSMGPQSVGKSFLLNHFLDTSFAGSAMRTTEGVWMSVTPTDEELIVALDFEGVGSIERTVQEDTLLVLFNAAISNLVLFCNNFAFGRDISGFFQSFQASASVLDPEANPSLFRSTLLIIIKDVMDSDVDEIDREFRLRFQRIVQEDNEHNFISRLHRGKMNIIPWPLIGSKEFYGEVSVLKKGLDDQQISHPTAREFLHTIKTLMAKLKAKDWGMLSQTMVEHRARALSAVLPIALATGYSETEPDLEPLKNLDTDLIVECEDTTIRFPISDCEVLPFIRHLGALRESWNSGTPRQSIPDLDWVSGFGLHINGLVDLRGRHVQLWLDSNLERFKVGHAAVKDLRRKFDKIVIEMRRNVQLCQAPCGSCHLLCVRNHLHMGEHNCETKHKCVHSCTLCGDSVEPCGLPAGHPGEPEHVCVVKPHLCGKPCKLSMKFGCLESCAKERLHVHDEHTCSAPLHMCGEPCDLQELKLPGGETYSCQERCIIRSGLDHQVHSCNTSQCPAECALCDEPCKGSHLHGLTWDVHHLCGDGHPCQALCAAPGICDIHTMPLTTQPDSMGRYLTFQHTKYTQVAKRRQCAKIIEPGKMVHTDPHIHTCKKEPFHYCETRCSGCGNFCTLELGHTQQEHETSHGSMTQTCWSVEGPDEEDIELEARTFSSNDDGTSMMCNLVCSSMGRHVHIDYCLSNGGTCKSGEVRHINARITPNPDRPKDAITHSLYWRRMGFKDPYTRHEQINFRKCDAMCSGSEHSASEPSYCTLPMFHPPSSPDEPVNGSGYVSSDGHLFECRSPAAKKRAFHVIFIIDSSGSMLSTDHQPLVDTPVADQIRQHANNRLGAVYSALYSFWSARHVASARDETISTRFQRAGFRPINLILLLVDDILETIVRTVVGLGKIIGKWITGGSKATPRDAYSVILFNNSTKEVLVNDTTSSPDKLLKTLLSQPAGGSSLRNIPAALRAAEAVMVQNWSPERIPIMVFLSTGQGSVSDEAIRGVCRSAIEHGKPLTLYAVSFGGKAPSTSPLPKMANLALKIQKDAARSHTVPEAANIPSTFTTALDTVHLTSIFLGFEESLRKPRPSSMN